MHIVYLLLLQWLSLNFPFLKVDCSLSSNLIAKG